MTFPIVEYDVDPLTDTRVDPPGLIWEDKVSIDLRWVASASPQYNDTTIIQMCGCDQYKWINIPYTTFMEDWLKAKGITQ
jgi:hypothetical protein